MLTTKDFHRARAQTNGDSQACVALQNCGGRKLRHSRLNRRPFQLSCKRLAFERLARLMLWMAVAMTPALQAAGQQPGADKRPNVVFIISDDQAWNDYSFMGHAHIETPKLDQLAAESLVFTRGYVPDSLCRPSLATIISGLYPHQHGIVGNDPPPNQAASTARGRLYRNPEYQAVVEEYLRLHIDRLETLPDRLAPLGYRSFQTGKWWEGSPSRGGFDDGMTHGDVNRGGRHGDLGLKIGREGMQPITRFVRECAQDQVPYFLWYAPFMPHTPHTPPARLLDKYRELAPTVPIAKYWAMCEWFDETVGELRQVIATESDPNNTIIVYVCDNGWINQREASRYAPRSKRTQYEGGIRTPIMVHWPGRIAPRQDDQHAVCSIDIVPTMLQLIGQPQDPELPGIDLTNTAKVAARQVLFGEIFEHDIQSMDDPRTSLLYRWAIEGNMKLIVPNSERVPQAAVELFDLQNDPWEEHDLAASQPELVNRLTEAINAWWP